MSQVPALFALAHSVGAALRDTVGPGVARDVASPASLSRPGGVGGSPWLRVLRVSPLGLTSE